MSRKINSAVIPGPGIAMEAALAVERVYSEQTLWQTPEVIRMFDAADSGKIEEFPMTLSTIASRRVVRALEAQSKEGGNESRHAVLRLRATLSLFAIERASLA